MMYYNKINAFIINIIDIINNDKILINYILISLCCLFLLDCNIIYKKIKKEEKFSFIYIIKINITLFLSLIILLFSYDILFKYDDILLNKSFIFKLSDFYINSSYILKIFWSFSFFLIILIALNFIKRSIQIVFTSFFISINSYFMNLWSITKIDDVILDNSFILWKKVINKDLLYKKVILINETIVNNSLTSIDIIKWINNNLDTVYAMEDVEVYNNLIDLNNKNNNSNINSSIQILYNLKDIVVGLSSGIIIITLGIVGCKVIYFVYNRSLLDYIFNINRVSVEDIGNHNINNINELADVIENVADNNNSLFFGLRNLWNVSIGLFRVLSNINEGITNDITPRIVNLEHQIEVITRILEQRNNNGG